jgi:hypothetical protein
MLGKFLYLFIALLAGTPCIQAVIELRLVDALGRTVSEVEKGQSCTVELILSDKKASGRLISVDNPQNLAITSRQSHLQIINGERTMRYTYILRPDTLGDYTFGPAHVMVDNQTETSNKLSFAVVERKAVSDVSSSGSSRSVDYRSTSTDHQEQPIFMRLTSDAHEGLVGNPLRLTLAVYCLYGSTDIREIIEPAWTDAIKIVNHTGPTKSREIVDGNEYICLRWQWELIPTQPGTITISPFKGDFAVPQGQYHMMNSFFSFFQPPMEQLRVCSNALSLAIKKLPPYTDPVHGIGHFSNFVLETSAAHALQGEAITMKLSVDQSDGTQEIQELPCQGMPEGLKVYPSKTTIEQISPTKRRHVHEYVLQGLTVGTWTIPAQKFTYFDLTSETYVALTSHQKTVIIEPNPRATSNTQTNSQDSATSRAHNDEHDDTNNDLQKISEQPLAPQEQADMFDAPLPLRTYKSFVDKPEPYIPVWLFLLMIVGCVGFAFKKELHTTLHNYCTPYMLRKKIPQKIALAHAKKALKKALEKQDSLLLYEIFVQLFSNLLRVQQTEITNHAIENYLAEHTFTESELHAWQQFFLDTSSARYFQNAHVSVPSEKLFNDASELITSLEKKI